MDIKRIRTNTNMIVVDLDPNQLNTVLALAVAREANGGKLNAAQENYIKHSLLDPETPNRFTVNISFIEDEDTGRISARVILVENYDWAQGAGNETAA